MSPPDEMYFSRHSEPVRSPLASPVDRIIFSVGARIKHSASDLLGDHHDAAAGDVNLMSVS